MLAALVEANSDFLLPASMTHEIAKLMLEHAGSFLERAEAIRVAMSLGMPLNEIEQYLDWLDAMHGPPRKSDSPDKNNKTGTRPK